MNRANGIEAVEYQIEQDLLQGNGIGDNRRKRGGTLKKRRRRS
jgi:hypothetical protein